MQGKVDRCFVIGGGNHYACSNVYCPGYDKQGLAGSHISSGDDERSIGFSCDLLNLTRERKFTRARLDKNTIRSEASLADFKIVLT